MNNSEAKNSNIYELSKGNCVTFRNNCGCLLDARGVPVFYGVAGPKKGKKSLGGSDFIGYESVIITPEMVGKRVAIFTAHELKADEDNTKPETLMAQENFIDVVNKAGGRAGFVRRPIDVHFISQGRGCVKLSEYPKDRLISF